MLGANCNAVLLSDANREQTLNALAQKFKINADIETGLVILRRAKVCILDLIESGVKGY